MKKNFKIFVLIILSLFLINGALALSSNLKEKYDQKETIIISFSGKILEPINFNQVEFLKGHVKIPLDYDIKKVGDKYYLWAIAPENEGNYSLIVKDIVTFINGAQTKYSYIKNFSVSGNKTSYSIKPGFIISDKDFSINVFLYEDDSKKINLNFPNSREVTLEPGNNKIDFSIKEAPSSGFMIMKVGFYDVPIEITSNKSAIYDNKLLPSSLFFEPSEIKYSFNKSSELKKFLVKLKNKGEKSLTITFQYDEGLFKVDPLPKTIKANQTIEITIQLKKIINESVTKKISVSSTNETAILPIYFEIIKDRIVDKNATLNATNSSQLFCSQILGVICEKGSICEGEVKQSKDGSCCLGVCKTEEKGGISKIISFLIFGIVILIILIVWVKYKRSKKNTEEVLGKKDIEKNKKIP